MKLKLMLANCYFICVYIYIYISFIEHALVLNMLLGRIHRTCPIRTTKVTAVPYRGSVPFLIHLIKAAGVVTSLGGRRVNFPFQFAWSRLILDEESKGVKIL